MSNNTPINIRLANNVEIINQDIQKALKKHYSQGGLNDAKNAATDFGLFMKTIF